MITYNSNEVRITAGDRRLREATIEWESGKIRVVPLHRLKGTHGGVMEVVVMWEAACKRSEALERDRCAVREYLAPAVGGKRGTSGNPRRGDTLQR